MIAISVELPGHLSVLIPQQLFKEIHYCLIIVLLDSCGNTSACRVSYERGGDIVQDTLLYRTRLICNVLSVRLAYSYILSSSITSKQVTNRQTAGLTHRAIVIKTSQNIRKTCRASQRTTANKRHNSDKKFKYNRARRLLPYLDVVAVLHQGLKASVNLCHRFQHSRIQ